MKFSSSPWGLLSFAQLAGVINAEIALPKKVGAHEAVTIEVPPTAPLSADEEYLAPYLNDVLDYRENPIARRYIMLANLVDAVPTWLVDLFVPLVIPGSTFTMDLEMKFPIKIPVFGALTNANFVMHNITFTDLNEFKTLKPIKLNDNSKFTWDSVVSLKELGISAKGGLEFDFPWPAQEGDENLEKNSGELTTSEDVKSLTMFDVDVNLNMVSPSLQASAIVAFDSAKLCSVWGSVLRSSASCAAWPLWTAPEEGFSGLNVTNFVADAADYDLTVSAKGVLGPTIDDMITKSLQKVLDDMKPSLLKNLPGSMSQTIKEMMNISAIEKLPKLPPCDGSATNEIADEQQVDEVKNALEVAIMNKSTNTNFVDVSQICIVNNGGFAMKWKSHNCPARLASDYTDVYAADQMKCMNANEVFPGAQAGDVLRVGTQVTLGLHEIPDPPLKYMPDSNAAGFICGRTTLTYSCDLKSLVPVDPAKLPKVRNICILNQAGFAMFFDSMNLRNQQWSGRSGTYPVNQIQCKDLGETLDPAGQVVDGDEFAVRTQAIGGKNQETSRHVLYDSDPNGLSVTYVCKGTTMQYSCELMSLPVAQHLQAEQVCVQNHGGFAMFWDANNERTGAWVGKSDTYPNPQSRCMNLSSPQTSVNIQEGDIFRVETQAIAGKRQPADSKVMYARNSRTVTFDCGGSTMQYECKLVGVTDMLEDDSEWIMI